MSRSSNRGPRADIALLRKLKADPNFTPSSLLNAGNDILEKANKLKGFVSQQRGKLGASTAKTEWLLAFQHLQVRPWGGSNRCWSWGCWLGALRVSIAPLFATLGIPRLANLTLMGVKANGQATG